MRLRRVGLRVRPLSASSRQHALRALSRRTVLAGGAALAAATLEGGSGLAQGKAAPGRVAAAKAKADSARAAKFFTARELAVLDEVAELLIPADAQSGGARAAGVAQVLDARIGESRDPAWRKSWREDLAEIDRLSQVMFRKGFLEATAEQRIALMTRISRNEAAPKEPGEWAFGTIKWSVADVYYRTRIGIHDDLQYKGNTIQDEFSGIDVAPRRG